MLTEDDDDNFEERTENMNGDEHERDLEMEQDLDIDRDEQIERNLDIERQILEEIVEEIRNGPDENITETIESQRRMIETNVSKPLARARISENNNSTCRMSTSITNRANIGGTKGMTIGSRPVNRPTMVKTSLVPRSTEGMTIGSRTVDRPTTSFIPPSARHNVTPSSTLEQTEEDVLNEIISEIRNGPDKENITGSLQSQRRMIEKNVSEPPGRPSASNRCRNMNSRTEKSASIRNRANIGGARRTTVTSRSMDRSTCLRSAFVPSRARRNVRATSEIEYVSNINQLFDDGGDDDEAFDSSPLGHSRGRRSIRNEEANYDLSRRDVRDRSDMRNVSFNLFLFFYFEM